MKSTIHRAEAALLGAVLALASLAAFGPALTQAANHHAFADQRGCMGIPFAMDVLSNLPFAVWGLLGIQLLVRLPKAAIPGPQRGLAALFFAGLITTAASSSWYHWATA